MQHFYGPQGTGIVFGAVFALHTHTNPSPMEIIRIDTLFTRYVSAEEMPTEDRELMNRAISQLETAYAPYSRFRVGAAVRLANGVICGGSNQENASYPLCMCAERVALYNASAQYPNEAPRTLAITVRNERMPVTAIASPCGACRQVIAEYAFRHRQPIRLLLKSDGPDIVEIPSITDLLPLGFDGTFL